MALMAGSGNHVMNKKHFFPVLLIATCVLSVTHDVHADTFSDYVSACKSALGFSSIPKFSCKDVNFRTPSVVRDMGLDFNQSNDYVAHRVVNDYVDAVFACRWVEQNDNPGLAVAGEMIVHNRRNGATCFFDMKDTFVKSQYPEVSINPVSPTGSGASKIWEPANGCTQCHAAGPYIASPEIINALESYGLINDGHDIGQDLSHRIYHAVGSTADGLNSFIQAAVSSSCTHGCHLLGGSPEVPSIKDPGQAVGVVMPSINFVIDKVLAAPAAMAPDDPYSDYRWMNHHGVGGSGDWELLPDEASQFPGLYNTCQNPTILQAHVVDSKDVFSTDDGIPDTLNTFDMQDGLVCINTDQSNGQCHDYQLRYLCDGTWTNWINNDSPLGKGRGDFERRSDPAYKNICSAPTEMQAMTLVDVTTPNPRKVARIFTAPNDRLFEFNPQRGLGCQNVDQPSGHCANYVVRFICPN